MFSLLSSENISTLSLYICTPVVVIFDFIVMSPFTVRHGNVTPSLTETFPPAEAIVLAVPNAFAFPKTTSFEVYPPTRAQN